MDHSVTSTVAMLVGVVAAGFVALALIVQSRRAASLRVRESLRKLGKSPAAISGPLLLVDANNVRGATGFAIGLPELCFALGIWAEAEGREQAAGERAEANDEIARMRKAAADATLDPAAKAEADYDAAKMTFDEKDAAHSAAQTAQEDALTKGQEAHAIAEEEARQAQLDAEKAVKDDADALRAVSKEDAEQKAANKEAECSSEMASLQADLELSAEDPPSGPPPSRGRATPTAAVSCSSAWARS